MFFYGANMKLNNVTTFCEAYRNDRALKLLALYFFFSHFYICFEKNNI